MRRRKIACATVLCLTAACTGGPERDAAPSASPIPRGGTLRVGIARYPGEFPFTNELWGPAALDPRHETSLLAVRENTGWTGRYDPAWPFTNFKTGVPARAGRRGSIPVRLREPIGVRTPGGMKYGWIQARDSTTISSTSRGEHFLDESAGASPLSFGSPPGAPIHTVVEKPIPASPPPNEGYVI